MATENRGRMTPEEARAVIQLWSQRQWERQHWPSVADVAEGLGIPAAEVEALLREVQAEGPLAHPNQTPSLGSRRRSRAALSLMAPPLLGAGGPFAFHLAAGVAGLTTVFSLFLIRILA